jgi:uncharacterized protein
MKRVCGPCTLCCRFFAVPEIAKPAQEWCAHCSAAGCGIHADRPQSCRNFECFWLMDEGFPEDLRPDRCGIVVSWNGEERDSVLVHLEPERADALGESAGAGLLTALLGAFERVIVVCGAERMMVSRRAPPATSSAPAPPSA